MYVNFLSTYSDKKSCHTSITLQTSIARFVSDSWTSCLQSELRRNCSVRWCVSATIVQGHSRSSIELVSIESHYAISYQSSFVRIYAFLLSLTCQQSCLDSPTHSLVKPSLIIPALIIRHSFALSLHVQNLPFQQGLFYPLGCLLDNRTGPYQSRSSFYF